MSFPQPKPCTKCGELAGVHVFLRARLCYACWNTTPLTQEEADGLYVPFFTEERPRSCNPRAAAPQPAPKAIAPVYQAAPAPVVVTYPYLDVYFPGDAFPYVAEKEIDAADNAYRPFFSKIREKAGIARV